MMMAKANCSTVSPSEPARRSSQRAVPLISALY